MCNTARRMEPVDFKNCAGDRIRSDCFRYWIKAVACRFNIFDVFSAICASAFRTFGKRSAKTLWLEKNGSDELLQRMQIVTLPQCAQNGTMKERLEYALWGEAGDYVRNLIKSEW